MNEISNKNLCAMQTENAAPRKKRAYRYKHSLAPVKKSTILTPEEEDQLMLIRLQTKRIRYLNPMRFYVTADGHTFPTVSDESYDPVYLNNLSNKVLKVAHNSVRGELIYYLTPRFDATDIISSQYIIDKLTSDGEQESYALARKFETFIQKRERVVDPYDPDILEIFKALKSEHLSNTVPQIAEIRVYKGSVSKYIALSRYIINKPMQKLLGINADLDPIISLQSGVKFPQHLIPSESIRFLQNYYDLFSDAFNNKFRNSHIETDLFTTTWKIDGRQPIDMKVTARRTKYDDEIAWIFSYYDQNTTEKAMKNSDVDSDDTQLDQLAKIESQTVQKTMEIALEYIERFKKPEINDDEDMKPPEDRVCRIRELKYTDT